MYQKFWRQNAMHYTPWLWLFPRLFFSHNLFIYYHLREFRRPPVLRSICELEGDGELYLQLTLRFFFPLILLFGALLRFGVNGSAYFFLTLPTHISKYERAELSRTPSTFQPRVYTIPFRLYTTSLPLREHELLSSTVVNSPLN